MRREPPSQEHDVRMDVDRTALEIHWKCWPGRACPPPPRGGQSGSRECAFLGPTLGSRMDSKSAHS